MDRNHLFTQQIWQARPVRTLRHLVSPQRIYRRISAKSRCLPDFIIAGAQKSGTTSLWAYLAEHPQVEPPMTKEMSFFDVNFQRGVDWYRMFFPLRRDCGADRSPKENFLTGESTAYYLFHPLAPARIVHMLPDVKVILLLRNPVSRAWSHYQLKLRRRQETLSFEDAIASEPERLAGEHQKIVSNPNYYSLAHDRYSYLARGRYLEQIQRWQGYFPPSQLLILESGEFFRHTEQVFARVLEFLGLRQWRPAEFGNRFPGRYRATMNDATRRRLIDYFAPYNEQLYAQLGMRFDWETASTAGRNQAA